MEQFTNHRITQIDFTDVSQTVTLSEMCKQLIFSATEHCYIRINQDDVSASNGFLIRTNSKNIIDLTQVSKIAAIRVTTSGKLTILELF